MTNKKEKPYNYSFGRKAFFTTLGIIALLSGLMIGAKMDIDAKLYYAYCGGVVALITQFSINNARISIAHCKNKSGG